MAFQGIPGVLRGSKGVSGALLRVLKAFHGFQKPSMFFFQGASSAFQGSSRKFQGAFHGVSGVFRRF